MTRGGRILCWVYGIIAAIALYATWNHNLAFFGTPNNGGIAGFMRDAYVNHASSSFANDLFAFGIAGVIFMIAEARRVSVPRVWLYIAISLLIAISVGFPLFLIERQVALAKRTTG